MTSPLKIEVSVSINPSSFKEGQEALEALRSFLKALDGVPDGNQDLLFTAETLRKEISGCIEGLLKLRLVNG